jgi:hypothetical protein
VTKWHWVPLLCLALVVIPCDTGIVLPDFGILLESFQRLTARNPFVHVPLYLEMIASVAIVRRSPQAFVSVILYLSPKVTP